MRFPKAEPKIVSLIHEIIAGLEAHPDLFPNPPVSAEDLRKQFNTYLKSADTANQKQAEAKHAVEEKNHDLDAAVESGKMILRYAETTTHSDDAALNYLGWGAHREPSRLKSPGQTRHLEAPRQGDGWIALDWKQPDEGGKAAAYKIQRREGDSETWLDAGMAMDTEVTLTNQPRGVRLEFRVVAVNKAGEGEPSNGVLATL
uniref:Fibronectin type III domain-containing protein n=2 Tax=Candidatus Kentrum sp. TC TaxID=2126339 RepID=A0A450ZD05_9GAMM|nr:MAG: Fibronectin type III domain-containing protein [Candidatus Kentron sp. TC]